MDFALHSPVGSTGYLIAGGIVLLGLLFGLRDVLRFSSRRIAAIGSVCFRQSIRRRVLFITPLVIVGIVVVSQLQKGVDAQDVVRQTTTYSIFATGLLMAMVTIILACTNLPREIESRVIYTIATKPTTRLEIVLGKIVGFVCVSFWLLLIMGIFTWGYLQFRDWQLRRYIANVQLPAISDADPARRTLEYYRDHGTLHARDLAPPQRLSFFAHLPKSDDDRYSPAGGEGEIRALFVVDRKLLGQPGLPDVSRPDAAPTGGLVLQAAVEVRPAERIGRLASALLESNLAPTHFYVFIRNQSGEVVVSADELGTGRGAPAEDGLIQLFIPPTALDKVMAPDDPPTPFYLCFAAREETHAFRMSADKIAVRSPETGQRFRAMDVVYTGRLGAYGQQLRGTPGGNQRVAVFEYRNQDVPPEASGEYLFELRAGIELDRRNDSSLEDELQTNVVMDVYNRKSGNAVKGILVRPESRQPHYFQVPAAAVAGGDFDVVMRVESGSWLGLGSSAQTAGLKFVREDQPFAWNLIKSFSVLWLLSLLITIVSIFCSTFLSWPIAVVLTLVILAGRWGANQLGDLTELNFGRQWVEQTLGVKTDATAAAAMSEGVDTLVQALELTSRVLPDISKFAAVEDIERGVAISPTRVLLPSLAVTLIYGLPLIILAYIFLRYKEVAP